MDNKIPQNQRSEISVALRYIIKSAALMAHHRHLKPIEFTYHIPMLNEVIIIPKEDLEYVHSFIGIVLLILWLKVNVVGAIEIYKSSVKWGKSAIEVWKKCTKWCSQLWRK